MENNTTIFETGATSPAVNELILYTDTTRELAEVRDKYYSFSLNSTNVLSMRMIDLFWTAVRKYKNEFWRREQYQHITEMTDTERREYCQIYANRFADWKKEKELRAKQFNQFHHAAKHNEYNNSWDLFRSGTLIGSISEDGKMLHLSIVSTNIPFSDNHLEEISSLMKDIQSFTNK